MRLRAIFFDQDTALLVQRLLKGDGYDAEVLREPFAGEDDDEDHPWAVHTDAPDIALELLVEAHDGWLEADQPPAIKPLDLPQKPKRTHRREPEGG